MRGSLILGTVLLAACSLDAVAGVRARVERKGEYLGTEIDVRGQRTSDIWRVPTDRRIERSTIVNPRGQALGDLWPTMVESRVAPFNTWIVWSRHNGVDYDLVWSRWNQDRWEPIRPVHSGPSAGDDLDADLVFDSQGRAYLVWWRHDQDGVGRVYLSTYLAQRWSTPHLVSTGDPDGRYPRVKQFDAATLRVRYRTPDGASFDQFVHYDRPVTITDDLNPLGIFRNKARVQAEYDDTP